MEGNTKRNRMALRLLFMTAITVAAVAVMVSAIGHSSNTAEATDPGTAMGLRVAPGDTMPCPNPEEGKVCVDEGAKFTVIASADVLPPNGIIFAGAWLDYGDTGLVSKDVPGLLWLENLDFAAGFPFPIIDPGCNATLFQSITDLPNNGTAAGCITGSDPAVPNVPVQVVDYKGVVPFDMYSFSLTCNTNNSHTIKLLAVNEGAAGTSGSLYTEFGTAKQYNPTLGSLTVNCVGPTPTPSDTPIPPTVTPTISPTATNTPTPLPPPSERPDVMVTKVDLVDPVDSESAISYQITVESIGLQTAEDVVVEDTLPAGSLFKSATSADATCDDEVDVVTEVTVVTCEVTNNMAPTDPPITIDIVVNAPIGADALVDNTVTVTSSNEPFANTGNNKDIEQTMVLAPRSDVTLSKVGDPTFLDTGGDVTYTLVAKNLGPHSAQNVQIKDTLPGNATFVSATNPECGAPAGGDVTCDLGKLAPGAESIVQIVMHVPDVTKSIFLKNSAIVSAANELYAQTGNNLAMANTPVVAPPPDLVVTKTDSQDPVLRLGNYSYEITVLNQGSGDALDVVVTDTLPVATIDLGIFSLLSAATFKSAVGADCQVVFDGDPVSALDGHKIECTIDEINVGQQAVITFNVRGPTLVEDENLINNVTASASDPDENPAGNDASEATLVRACFDVSGDLIVDLPNDILEMILVLGLTEGDIGYDVIYDFDGDGRIGLPFDVLPVIQHFGQDCSLLL